jgi:glycosyltransferase involved in cell wall biosynthesis
VTVRGYVEEVASVFDTAALQAHPARFDPSPVSTLEGMRAGVPPIVSPRTGTRSEAERIDSSLVVPGTPDAIADRVVSYFQSSIATRESYSTTARAVGREFEAASNRETFRRQFDSLL